MNEPVTHQSSNDLAAALHRALAQRDQLRAYVTHSGECLANSNGPVWKCICGLSELLATLRAEEKGGGGGGGGP